MTYVAPREPTGMQRFDGSGNGKKLCDSVLVRNKPVDPELRCAIGWFFTFEAVLVRSSSPNPKGCT